MHILQCNRELTSHTKNILSSVLSKDARFFATAGEDSYVAIWSVERALSNMACFSGVSTQYDRELTLRLKSSSLFNCMEFCPRSRSLLTGGMTGSLKHWDLEYRRATFNNDRAHNDESGAFKVLSVVHHPYNDCIFASCAANGAVKLWDTRDPAQNVFAWVVASTPVSATFSACGTHILCGTSSGVVEVLGVNKLRQMKPYIDISKSSHLIESMLETDNAFSVDLGSAVRRLNLEHGRLLVECEDGKLRGIRWPLTDGTDPTAEMAEGEMGASHGTAMTFDGQKIITLYDDGVRVFDAKSLSIMAEAHVKSAGVSSQWAAPEMRGGVLSGIRASPVPGADAIAAFHKGEKAYLFALGVAPHFLASTEDSQTGVSAANLNTPHVDSSQRRPSVLSVSNGPILNAAVEASSEQSRLPPISSVSNVANRVSALHESNLSSGMNPATLETAIAHVRASPPPSLPPPLPPAVSSLSTEAVTPTDNNSQSEYASGVVSRLSALGLVPRQSPPPSEPSSAHLPPSVLPVQQQQQSHPADSASVAPNTRFVSLAEARNRLKANQPPLQPMPALPVTSSTTSNSESNVHSVIAPPRQPQQQQAPTSSQADSSISHWSDRHRGFLAAMKKRSAALRELQNAVSTSDVATAVDLLVDLTSSSSNGSTDVSLISEFAKCAADRRSLFNLDAFARLLPCLVILFKAPQPTHQWTATHALNKFVNAFHEVIANTRQAWVSSASHLRSDVEFEARCSRVQRICLDLSEVYKLMVQRLEKGTVKTSLNAKNLKESLERLLERSDMIGQLYIPPNESANMIGKQVPSAAV